MSLHILQRNVIFRDGVTLADFPERDVCCVILPALARVANAKYPTMRRVRKLKHGVGRNVRAGKYRVWVHVTPRTVIVESIVQRKDAYRRAS